MPGPNLSAERWAALTRRAYREDENGALVSRCRSDDRRNAARGARRDRQSMALLEGAARDTDAGHPRRAVRHFERRHLCQDESGESASFMQLEVAQRGHAPLLDEPECIAAIDAFLAQAALICGRRRYLRHKVGVNSTRMVNTSSRPNSIAAEQTQVWKSLNTP